MNIFQAEIDRLKSGIAEALPGVIVRGSLIDHESLRRDELQNGVITVLLERIENDGDWRSKLRLLITGQLEVPGRPGDVEEQAALGAVCGRGRPIITSNGLLPPPSGRRGFD